MQYVSHVYGDINNNRFKLIKLHDIFNSELSLTLFNTMHCKHQGFLCIDLIGIEH